MASDQTAQRGHSDDVIDFPVIRDKVGLVQDDHANNSDDTEQESEPEPPQRSRNFHEEIGELKGLGSSLP